MYKTILVPIDLGHPEHGAEVLAKARSIAGAAARIVTLYVSPDIPGYVVSELPRGVTERVHSKAEADLTAVAAPHGAEAMVKKGPAAATIIEVAEKIGADLIVVGSHRPGLSDYFLGSTAGRVVRHAHCSVLVDR